MKIIIFGGGGFVGSAIVDRLLVEGHDLRVFERPRVEAYRTFLTTEKVEWMTGDMLSGHDLHMALEDRELVIHLVSTTLPKSSNEDPIYDVQSNLVGTLQILNSMVEMNIKKIIFISSGGTVYGTPKYLPIDEKHPCNPQVSYGIIKLAIENYLLLYKRLHGIKPIIFRVANPYGKRQRVETAQGAIGVFIHRAINNQSIDIWGDGSSTRDYIYIDDVAEIFALAVHYSGSKNIFNVSSGIGTSLNELLDTIQGIFGHPIAWKYLPKRDFDISTSVLSNEKALSELGWKPNTSLRKGIEMTINWVRNEASSG